MNVILDTHTFIWLDGDASRLSAKAVQYLTDPASLIFLSVASIWEMVVKVGSGKLTLRTDVRTLVAEQTTRNPIQLLPILAGHAYELGTLPPIHKDPFDRMLVSQAIVENAILLTVDPMIRKYPVRTDW